MYMLFSVYDALLIKNRINRINQIDNTKIL